MIKINKERIIEIKELITDVMGKKSELELQIQEFKDSIEEIKSEKKRISKMIDDINPNKAKENRVLAIVREKIKS